ncbi:MAG: ATP-binding cassette domain-containing protein, partial [Oscillospiraceae bacterium]|nr:ATP-binding cassette domain-containing protein [Oscillospiraceae bacterium]
MENKTKDFLSVSNLVVTYNAGKEIVHAVNNVSFSLEKGQNLALVGETGAGKTSIAKAILRILPNPQGQIQNGTIVFDGKDLLSLNEREMRTVRGKRISMVFQDPMTALNPVKTVGCECQRIFEPCAHQHLSH